MRVQSVTQAEETMENKEQTIKMIQYFSDHWYRRVIQRDKSPEEIRWYASTTTKLGIVAKYGLDKWRGDIGNREADLRMMEAASRGSRIHKAWEVYQMGGSVGYWRWQLDEEKPEADFVLRDQGEYLDFLKLHYFTEAVKPDFLATEYILYSDKYGEAGTCDNILGIKGGSYMIGGSKPVVLKEGTYIADLKSGKAVYDEAFLQVADYTAMYMEMGLAAAWGEIQGALILHTKATTRGGIIGFSATLRTIEQLREDFKDYRAVAQMWERKNKKSAPKDFEFPQVIRRVVNEKTT